MNGCVGGEMNEGGRPDIVCSGSSGVIRWYENLGMQLLDPWLLLSMTRCCALEVKAGSPSPGRVLSLPLRRIRGGQTQLGI